MKTQSEIAELLSPRAYSENDLAAWEETLWNEGCLVIENALSPEAVAYFRERVLEVQSELGEGKNGFTLIGKGMDFMDFALHEPVHSLTKRILGLDMQLWLFIVHAMRREKTISGWHADDLYLLRPDGVSDDVPFPPIINVINCHYYLQDTPQELGPTEVVPFSHRACRQPDKERDGSPPIWRGHEPVSFTVKAGDCVVYSNHCWHRGAPITCEDTRYSIVAYYCRRFIQQRWIQEKDHGLTEELLEQCNEAQRALLGHHSNPPWVRPTPLNIRWTDNH
ncbi:MAG: hypothetical protein OHK0029_36420 [Armatimonadaceae bacterium]